MRRSARSSASCCVNTARPLIFSTGLPPPVVQAAEAALELLESEPERVAQLQSNAELLRAALSDEGLELDAGRTQIVPVPIGDPERAVAACSRALADGVYAQAIRPPTVPEGTSRLRLTVMATHEPAELRRAAEIIANAVRAVDVDGEWSIDIPEPEGEPEVYRVDADRDPPARSLGAAGRRQS